jgi:hypothetical protein
MWRALFLGFTKNENKNSTFHTFHTLHTSTLYYKSNKE